VLCHKDREVRLDLRREDPSEAAFAAFYANCLHEVLPITSGYRLTLVYNLIRPKSAKNHGRLPEPPDYETEQARLAEALRRWAAEKERPGDPAPEKLVYLLDHDYTQAELSLAALKGPDAAIAPVLTAAAAEADCELHLALLSITETGAAEYSGYYGSWGDEDSGDDYEVGEVDDRIATLSEWRRPDGETAQLGVFPFEDEEAVPPGALEEMEPDKIHFEEATGNAGASFERTYCRAALVLWPRRRRLAVFSDAGRSVSLPYLEDVTRRWAESVADPQSPLWREAHELSGYMVAGWHGESWYRGSEDKPSEAERMLSLLTRLADTERIDAFLAEITAAHVYRKRDNEAVMEALGLLPRPRPAELIARIIAGNAHRELSACADLLARAAAAADTKAGRAELVPAAKVLLEAMPGDPARAPTPEDPWRRQATVESGFIVDLVTGLEGIDAALAGQAVDYILTWPKTYPIDRILLPAMRRLSEEETSRDLPAARRLREACLAHLRARIAEPLAPPHDWAREAAITCKCADCTEVNRFLTDPDREIWSLRAAEHARSHVEESIRKAGSDLDLKTDRKGRPYTLVCTKNQASYEKRAKQRRRDLDDVALLEATA
jgi:hypothetical protein